MLRRRSRHRHADPARLRPGLKIRLVLAAAAAALGLLAAGCGGSGDSGAEEIDPALLAPSKPDYVSRADGLCGFYQERTERQGREALGLGAGDFRVLESGRVVFKAGRRPSDAAITGFVAEIAVPNLEDQIAELLAIRPPSGDEAQLTAVYDSIDAAAGKLAADPSQALDPARMRALFDPALKLARSYGFRICGARPPSVPAQ